MLDNNPFTITKRPASNLGDCMMCRADKGEVCSFPIGVFQLRLCVECLTLLRQAIEEKMSHVG